MAYGPPTPISFFVAPSPSDAPVEEEEYYSSWSLFLVCILLITSLLTSYYLQIKRIRAVHETLVSILAGMVVGLIVRLAPGTMIREMLTFKHTLFFNLLLPPIILNSGYELKQENFFRNFGSILTFAFFGTFISAVGVGLLVYVYSFLSLEGLELSLIECLTFGSTLSATDPVTILAIFNQYKVDPKLYTVIFGESLLNDAVSIVMYETLTQFKHPEVLLSDIFRGIGIFLLSFSASTFLGIVFGLSLSLLLKHSSLSLFPSLESSLVALTAYTCYFFSNGLSMSGIVSLLFCGITLKHYAYHTMSHRTQRASRYIFQQLAQLSENFIFVYLGMALFTSAPVSEPVGSYVKPLFITITTVAVVATRYLAVFPLAELINFVARHARGQHTEELPHSYQMMIFWAGLRGAVGVALAAGFKGPNAQIMRTTVLVVVVLTVVLFGGTTARMLEVLGIRTGVEDEEGMSSGEEEAEEELLRNAARGRGGVGSGAVWRRSSGPRWPEDESTSAIPSSSSSRQARIGAHYSPRIYNHHHQYSHTRVQSSPPGARGSAAPFSASSSDSYDSDSGEVLPLAPYLSYGKTVTKSNNNDKSNNSNGAGGSGPASQQIQNPPINPSSPVSPAPGGEDSKWFQTLDERYLLPLFSNATASRTFHARRARRGASGGVASQAESEDESHEWATSRDEVELGLGVGEEHRTERGLPSPVLRSNSSAGGLAGR